MIGKLVCTLALLGCSAAHAQGLTVLERSNDSTPGYTSGPAWAGTTFDTRLAVSAPVAVGATSHVDLRLSWLLAVLHDPPGLAQGSQLPTIGWSLVLRVEDPHDQGYALTVDTRWRGVLAVDTALTSIAESSVARLLPSVHEAFAPLPVPLAGAGMPPKSVAILGAMPSDREDIDESGHANVGRYTGTRMFRFFLPDTQLETIAQSVSPGMTRGWQQFGRTSSARRSSLFANPGVGDPALDDLGYFFRVSATFDALPVPEPESWLLLAAGLAWLSLRRVRHPLHGGSA